MPALADELDRRGGARAGAPAAVAGRRRAAARASPPRWCCRCAPGARDAVAAALAGTAEPTAARAARAGRGRGRRGRRPRARCGRAGAAAPSGSPTAAGRRPGGWRSAPASCRPTLLADRPVEERARRGWTVTWAVPLDDDGVPRRCRAGRSCTRRPRATSRCRCRLRLIAPFPLGPRPAARRARARSPTRWSRRPPTTYADLVAALPADPALLRAGAPGSAWPGPRWTPRWRRRSLDRLRGDRLAAGRPGERRRPAAAGAGRRRWTRRPTSGSPRWPACCPGCCRAGWSRRLGRPGADRARRAPGRHGRGGRGGARACSRPPSWWAALYAALDGADREELGRAAGAAGRRADRARARPACCCPTPGCRSTGSARWGCGWPSPAAVAPPGGPPAARAARRAAGDRRRGARRPRGARGRRGVDGRRGRRVGRRPDPERAGRRGAGPGRRRPARRPGSCRGWPSWRCPTPPAAGRRRGSWCCRGRRWPPSWPTGALGRARPGDRGRAPIPTRCGRSACSTRSRWSHAPRIPTTSTSTAPRSGPTPCSTGCRADAPPPEWPPLTAVRDLELVPTGRARCRCSPRCRRRRWADVVARRGAACRATCAGGCAPTRCSTGGGPTGCARPASAELQGLYEPATGAPAVLELLRPPATVDDVLADVDGAIDLLDRLGDPRADRAARACCAPSTPGWPRPSTGSTSTRRRGSAWRRTGWPTTPSSSTRRICSHWSTARGARPGGAPGPVADLLDLPLAGEQVRGRDGRPGGTGAGGAPGAAGRRPAAAASRCVAAARGRLAAGGRGASTRWTGRRRTEPGARPCAGRPGAWRWPLAEAAHPDGATCWPRTGRPTARARARSRRGRSGWRGWRVAGRRPGRRRGTGALRRGEDALRGRPACPVPDRRGRRVGGASAARAEDADVRGEEVRPSAGAATGPARRPMRRGGLPAGWRRAWWASHWARSLGAGGLAPVPLLSALAAPGPARAPRSVECWSQSRATTAMTSTVDAHDDQERGQDRVEQQEAPSDDPQQRPADQSAPQSSRPAVRSRHGPVSALADRRGPCRGSPTCPGRAVQQAAVASVGAPFQRRTPGRDRSSTGPDSAA